MKRKTDVCKEFFVSPKLPRQRRYEILRAVFVEELTAKQAGKRFDVSRFSVQNMVQDFRKQIAAGQTPEFFVEAKTGPKSDRMKSGARERIVDLRKRNYSDRDIHNALAAEGISVSVSRIDNVLRQEGLGAIGKRTNLQRQAIRAEIQSGQIPGLTQQQPAVPSVPAVADVERIRLEPGREIYSRVAGIFLFVPLLVRLGFDDIVKAAGMAGTSMIPPVSYALSLLALKLLDKERKSHINDWSFDEALGWFAGLNVMPKATVAADYTYRLTKGQDRLLLAQWIKQASQVLCPALPQTFAVDFHPIAHRGLDNGLENNYVSMRGKATASVQTAFVRGVDSPILCYANADIVHKEQAQIPLKFVEFWKQIAGTNPDWLYMDSGVTTHKVLGQLDAMDVNFITIRRRGAAMLKALEQRDPDEWKPAVIDTPQRHNQRIRLLDDQVKLADYEGTCRQVTADGFGREKPTLFLTNNKDVTPKQVVTRYIGRNTIENELGINVNFFHMDCLSSEVRLNVSTDCVMTVIANGCYRHLGQQLKGFQTAEPKQIFRKFVETGGRCVIQGDELVVTLDRRSHNPVIAQAMLDKDAPPIPWLANKRLRIDFE